MPNWLDAAVRHRATFVAGHSQGWFVVPSEFIFLDSFELICVHYKAVHALSRMHVHNVLWGLCLLTRRYYLEVAGTVCAFVCTFWSKAYKGGLVLLTRWSTTHHNHSLCQVGLHRLQIGELSLESHVMYLVSRVGKLSGLVRTPSAVCVLVLICLPPRTVRIRGFAAMRPLTLVVITTNYDIASRRPRCSTRQATSLWYRAACCERTQGVAVDPGPSHVISLVLKTMAGYWVVLAVAELYFSCVLCPHGYKELVRSSLGRVLTWWRFVLVM